MIIKVSGAHFPRAAAEWHERHERRERHENHMESRGVPPSSLSAPGSAAPCQPGIGA
jgi:hypothetical protein